MFPPLVGVGADDGGAIGCLHFPCRDRGLGLQSENLASEFRRGGVALQYRPPGRREGKSLPLLLRFGRCRRLRWARGNGGVSGGAVNPPLSAPFGEFFSDVNLSGAAVRVAIIAVPIRAMFELGPAAGAAGPLSTRNYLVRESEMMRCLRWLGHG